MNLYQQFWGKVENGGCIENMEGFRHPVTTCKEMPLIESLAVVKLWSVWTYQYFVCSSSEAGCYWKNWCSSWQAESTE